MLTLPRKSLSLVNPAHPVNRAHPLTRGLVAWYLAGLTPRGNTWRDIARHNHGTLTNGPVWSGDFPRGGKGSLRFTAASSQYMALADSANLTFGTQDFTVAFRFKATTLDNSILGKGDDASNEWYSYLDGSAGNERVIGKFGGISGIIDPGTGNKIVANTWYWSAYTRSGSTFRYYQDGVFLADRTHSPDLNDVLDGFEVGSADTANFFDGSVSDVMLWIGRTHSASGIHALYRESLAGYPNMLNRISLPYGVAQEAGGALYGGNMRGGLFVPSGGLQ